MKRVCEKLSYMVLALFVFGFCSNSILALDSIYMTNKNGIEMTEVEYNNLLNLGFNDNEIQYMFETEFLANKDLIGEVVSQEITNIYDNNFVNPFAMTPGYISTAYRTLTTTIVSVNGKYRYKVSMEWQQIPSARSYDVIGIGIDSNVSIYSDVYFQQNFCYSANNCSSSQVFTRKITSTGGSATFQLPSASLVSMNSYMYFDVQKNTTSTITQLNAYGDYAHATQTVSLNNAINHSINRGGISHANSGLYDTFTVAKAVWTGSW